MGTIGSKTNAAATDDDTLPTDLPNFQKLATTVIAELQKFSSPSSSSLSSSSSSKEEKEEQNAVDEWLGHAKELRRKMKTQSDFTEELLKLRKIAIKTVELDEVIGCRLLDVYVADTLAIHIRECAMIADVILARRGTVLPATATKPLMAMAFSVNWTVGTFIETVVQLNLKISQYGSVIGKEATTDSRRLV